MTVCLEKVYKKIKGSEILADISLSLHSGKIVGFRGVNGSGKTMLMRTIAGLIHPTSGQVSVDGEILGEDISFPRSLGVLIENPAFLDDYSGIDNLRILASIRNRISDDDIVNVLNRVGLDPKDRKKYKKYSLGMKQRLGIAAAIMEKPSIIILDEPTNALDTDGVELVRKILFEEKARDALIILSSHDSAILDEMADEIYYLKEGHISGYTVKEDAV